MAANSIQKIKPQNLSNKERILKLLRENPDNNFTYGEIAAELNISKTNIGKIINPLAQKDKIKIVKLGNKKLVSIKTSSSSDRSSSDQSSSDPFSQKECSIPKDITPKDNLDQSSSDRSSSDRSSSDRSSSDRIQTLQEISKKSNREVVNYLKGMKQEIVDFGRVIPLDEKQRIVNWVLQNKADLIDSFSTSLSAYRKEKYPKIIRQKKRWHEQMKFLEGL